MVKKKHAGGHPPKYKTPEELQAKIDEYFESGISTKQVVVGPPNRREIQELKVPGIVDLALYLGFADRQSIRDNAARNDEFSCIIKNAIARIEAWNETNLVATNSTGSIFWLKNHGWADKQEHEHTGNFGLTVSITGETKDGPADLETD